MSLFGTGCSTKPPASTVVTSWRPVRTWSGTASLQTESFVSDTGAFRAHWIVHNADPANPGVFKLTLHSAVSGRPLVPMVEHRGDADETTYVSEDPREFFLVIDAERISWSVELEEAVQRLERPRTP